MGVWIEIPKTVKNFFIYRVTPCVGVWIEIEYDLKYRRAPLWSLPAWECGLKSYLLLSLLKEIGVTPCVGVWIEIFAGL